MKTAIVLLALLLMLSNLEWFVSYRALSLDDMQANAWVDIDKEYIQHMRCKGDQ
jgi:hypothetical protein